MVILINKPHLSQILFTSVFSAEIKWFDLIDLITIRYSSHILGTQRNVILNHNNLAGNVYNLIQSKTIQ